MQKYFTNHTNFALCYYFPTLALQHKLVLNFLATKSWNCKTVVVEITEKINKWISSPPNKTKNEIPFRSTFDMLKYKFRKSRRDPRKVTNIDDDDDNVVSIVASDENVKQEPNRSAECDWSPQAGAESKVFPPESSIGIKTSAFYTYNTNGSVPFCLRTVLNHDLPQGGTALPNSREVAAYILQ